MDIKLYSYLFGLFGTDGSVCRNKTNKHIEKKKSIFSYA